jgi:GAF domain-containing protein
MLKRITDKVRDTLDEAQILQTAVQELGKGLGVRCCNTALYDLASGTTTIGHEYNTTLFPTQGQVTAIADFPELYGQLLQGQYFQFCAIAPNPMRGRVATLACAILDDQEVLGDLGLINDQDYAF